MIMVIRVQVVGAAVLALLSSATFTNSSERIPRKVSRSALVPLPGPTHPHFPRVDIQVLT